MNLIKRLVGNIRFGCCSDITFTCLAGITVRLTGICATFTSCASFARVSEPMKRQTPAGTLSESRSA
jgi:hypothetical protein